MADQKDASMTVDGNQGEKPEGFQSQLGVLEEDDEFEEFPASGACSLPVPRSFALKITLISHKTSNRLEG